LSAGRRNTRAMMRREEVNSTMIVCRSRNEAEYDFKEHMRSHSARWFTDGQALRASNGQRTIEWMSIDDNIMKLRGVKLIVRVTDDAARDMHHRRQRYGELKSMVDHLNGKYVHE